jgi:ribonuclease HII
VSINNLKNLVQKPYWIMGIDEVGRGPLAGPVCVCACAMPYEKYKNTKASFWKIGKVTLTDSKKMTEKSRELWFEKLQKMRKVKEIFFATTFKSAKEIDKKGISRCIKDCISSNLKKLNIKSDVCVILLDGGLYAPIEYENQKTIIKGDLKKKIISAASVYAKVLRDNLMRKMDKKYPKYRWIQNKGYGTKDHVKAIKDLGLTSLHRKSFLTNIIDSV